MPETGFGRGGRGEDGALLKTCVPAIVPGIAFLSGGQSDQDATAHLDAMNRIGGLPWKLTSPTAARCRRRRNWPGLAKRRMFAAGQAAFSHRAQMNSLATKGEWRSDLEGKKAA